ncbi:MAG: hypothetical protein ABI162_19560 [Luteolibacter sp.]
MALLFGISAPVMPENRWLFLFGGIGYSALLAFLGVGFAIMPKWLRVRTMIGLFAINGLGIVFLTAVCVIAKSDPPSLSILDWLLPPAMWIGYAVGVLVFGLACYGWYHRFRHPAPYEGNGDS